LDVEDWAEIRRLRRSEGVSISEIARVLAISRNTVKAALASDEPPQYRRRRSGSVVDVFEARIRELLQAFPAMPATVIAERVGWPYSIRTLSGRVAELRPVYLPPDPASRTSYVAGEIAQCDFWFPDIEVPVGFGQTRTAKQLPVLTMVTGYARWDSAVLIPSRRAEDLFAGWWQLIDALGAVPRVLVWDGEGAIGRWRGRRSELTVECQGFRGTLATKVIVCRPADPEAKGWSSGCTTTWNARSCPAGRSPRRAISTPNYKGFWSGRTPASTVRWDAARPIASTLTGPPCSRCRRCHQVSGGGRRPGRPGTTTFASTATTTPSTPA
jgi:transposase